MGFYNAQGQYVFDETDNLNSDYNKKLRANKANINSKSLQTVNKYTGPGGAYPGNVAQRQFPKWEGWKDIPNTEKFPIMGGRGQMSNIATGSDSAGSFNWQNENRPPGSRPNLWWQTGDATSNLEPEEFSSGLDGWNMGATNNQYGNNPFGSRLAEMQRRFPAGPESSTFDPDTLGGGTKPGILGKAGAWLGDNAMDVANLGLRLWGGLQQNKALDQNEQYLGDVRKAMLFDQADVDRRWDLAMGDYKVRQEDQNQHRAAQGMTNQYANVGHAKV